MKKQAHTGKPLLLWCQMFADFNVAEKNWYKFYKINIDNIGPPKLCDNQSITNWKIQNIMMIIYSIYM
jgi:hypothetical protein